MTEVVAVTARMSEQTPRDGRGVRLLARLAEARTGVRAAVVAGRDGPFGQTSWEDGRRRPRRRRGDAHCDSDTPATTTIGFLGCMSLAGATGAWATGVAPAVDPAEVVLVGTRPPPGDFDEAAQRAVEASPVTVVPPGPEAAAATVAALGDAPVDVHLDPDVLAPAENPAPYARAGGLSLAALGDLLAAVAARGPVVGVEAAAFHSQDDEALRTAPAGRILDAVLPLVA